MKLKLSAWVLTLLLLMTVCLSGCSNQANTSANASSSKSKSNGTVTLTIGAYSVVPSSLKAIFPLFQKQWKQKTGQTVKFETSYKGSGSETESIIQGFPADIAILSLEGHIEKLVKAGLITHNWKSEPHNGMITKSVVALGVRKGNPKNIQDWKDLTKKGVKVLFPNPQTSGGAQWDINAIYGAGLKMSGGNKQKTKQLLGNVYQNVVSLDKSGAASVSTFESGVGDVIVTYENTLIAANHSGKSYGIILPKDTISIENPVAVVDKNVEKHGNRKVAEAFVKFLWSKQAQKIFSKNGFRSVDPSVAKQFANQYKTPKGLFGIDYLGGWPKVEKTLYSDNGIWNQVVNENQ